MNTLVIHPDDRSTDFLCDIYEGKGWDVCDGIDVTGSSLRKEIQNHDRIIMMGHGIPSGMFAYRYQGLIINSEFVYLFRNSNKQYVYIWCNADEFVEKYRLFGFYTGMIISEPIEAYLCRVDATNEEVEHSNKLFASSIRNALDTDNILRNTLDAYVGDDNDVIQFNRQRIYEKKCS